MQRPCAAAVVASLLPSESSSQRSNCVFQEDAGCLSSICLLQQLDACSDGRMVLTEQCLKSPVPRFCEVVSAVCVVHGDVVVPDAGRESWSSCSVSRSHCSTDISQIEIVDQRLCKQRHYSAQKVHASLCHTKSTSQSFVFSVKRSSYFSLWQKLCNLTENRWFWSILGARGLSATA